ncbi:MAG: cysteine synthase [Phycisphaerales bacterium]
MFEGSCPGPLIGAFPLTTVPTQPPETTGPEARRAARVFESPLELLPGVDNPTPLVRVARSLRAAGIDLPDYRLYAKLEWMNPFGSVKDRAAAALIEDLEARGKLGPGRSVVEPTSGNTGLSLAMMANAKGYGMRAVVPNKVPLTKKALLKMAGAELDVLNDNLCPAPGLGDGSVNLAKTHAKAQPDKYAMPNQYENEANVRAHMLTTGPEIWRQTEGKITHFFATLGTSGTITGTGRYLKEQNPDIKVICVVPDEGHDVPGLRTPSALASTALFDEDLIDEILEIDHQFAYTTALEAIRLDALLAGPSSGLILEGARRVLKRDAPAHGVGVMIFCDDAFKYIENFIKHVPELAQGTTPPQ